MKDKQSQLMMLAAACVLVVLTTGGSWLHWRLVSTQQQELAMINNQRQVLEAAIAKSDVHQKLQTLQTQAKAYDNALPERNEVAGVIENLSRELTQMGVAERSVVTGNGTSTGQIHQIPVNVNFRGSFTSVFELLNHMQQSPRLVRVERLVIQRDLARPAQELAVSMNLRSFGRTAKGTHE